MKQRTRLLTILAFCFDENPFTRQQVLQVAEGQMSYFYPNCKTIGNQISFCLQGLRDDGVIEFLDNNGTYQFCSETLN